jgi:hypothetical protein
LYGVDSESFRPTIGELISALETDPKQFPKKRGKLKDARAADAKFADGVTWRAVFTVDESLREVYVLSLDPHDAAYAAAEKRI